jgi:2-iminobutanoate/2-iminopropanoate deaminase
MKKIIQTDKAPAAIGPYSQAVEANRFLFVSGQLPLNPATKEMPDDIKKQTKQVLENVGAILQAAGYDFEHVIKSTVLLADIKDFAAMNEVYAEFYKQDCPARAAYQVANLPLGAKVEIETIAFK